MMLDAYLSSASSCLSHLLTNAVRAFRQLGSMRRKTVLIESWDVTATVRPKTRTEKDPTVVELEKAGVRLLELDYFDEATISREAALYGADRPLDLLINVGGLSPHPKPWQEQTGEMKVKFRVMASIFPPPLAQFQNSFGTCMACRMAKTALNQGTVTMAREWEKEGRKQTMVNVEPGFISTRLTGWDGVDDITTCIAGLMRVFKDITPQDNGTLIKWDGNRIPYQIKEMLRLSSSPSPGHHFSQHDQWLLWPIALV
ncbi:hypothetical protein QC761_512670 [Podospora bellae-mahoneyi]|uniref:Uncharacterized protein n=1 Tax=Podospora bellae-mahoneyi TaxID=2093777 RepID=A0ABR0FG62_9PEZI|nr:hypothetical protein QC761_512670 [Podospora bellae-mahoneyi]